MTGIVAPLIVGVLVLLQAVPAMAGTALRVEDCRLAPEALVDRFGEIRRGIRQFVHVCPARAPDGSEPVRILTVRLDLAFAMNFFADHPSVRVPGSIWLLDRDDNVIGEIPGAFPEDPPGRNGITFDDWRGGFPYRIELDELGTRWVQPHSCPPMTWNPATRRYEERKRQ